MAYVQILTGLKLGTRADLTSPRFTVGRKDGNTLILTDPSISSRHCVIENNGNGVYTLKDLGSTNGTFVNDAKIKEQVLAPKDLIKFGSVEALFNGDDVVAPVDGRPIHTAIPVQAIRTAGAGPAVIPFDLKTQTGRPAWLIPAILGGIVFLGLLCFFAYVIW